jgi:aspartyl-tRNA(Asn)/glutamyl-tRNA(Gln) amidotransferase subunit C
MVNIEKLETLTKIKLTDAEKTAAIEFFEVYTAKFDKLENIDTTNTEPLITVSTLENVMREDIVYKILDRETLLENVPEQHDGYIIVPRILE